MAQVLGVHAQMFIPVAKRAFILEGVGSVVVPMCLHTTFPGSLR